MEMSTLQALELPTRGEGALFPGQSKGWSVIQELARMESGVMLNADLCGLQHEHFYLMVQTLLESSIREAWFGFIAVKPEATT